MFNDYTSLVSIRIALRKRFLPSPFTLLCPHATARNRARPPTQHIGIGSTRAPSPGAFAIGLSVSRERRQHVVRLALAIALAISRGEVESADLGLRSACKRNGLPDDEVPDFRRFSPSLWMASGHAFRRAHRRTIT